MSKQTRHAPLAVRAFPWVEAALFFWLVIWVYLSWPYMLDDALIHLRYAEFLLQQGRITYDGVHASFGTSSLLYVTLLAALRSLSSSPLLPRVVSTAAYALFFLWLAFVLRRSFDAAEENGSSSLRALLSMALLAVFVAPSAERWMNDGMETGLVFVDALAGFLVLRDLVSSPRLTRMQLARAFLFGLLSVLLRVELLILAGFLSGMSALEMFGGRVRRMGVEHPVRALIAAGMPLAGGLFGAAFVRVWMHALLPDTALAKAFGAAAWTSTLQMTATTVVSSFSFGIGLFLLWLFTFLLLLRRGRLRPADWLGNALFPFVLFLSAIRGQQIQGIRYFGWMLLFPLLWNLHRVAETHPQQREVSGLFRFGSFATLVFLSALLPAFAWESRTFFRLFRGRVEALQTFRAQNLTGLRGALGIAEDVGFVGYFTQGDLCDPYGLVNGRALARLTYEQRFDRCMAQHPRFAFGSREFLQKVKYHQDLAGWSVCGVYPFNNIRTSDVHFLVVAPAAVQAACPAEARPLAEVVPHLQ